MGVPAQPIYQPNTWQAFAGQHGLGGRPVVAFGFYPHWRPVLAGFVQGVEIRHVRNLAKIPPGSVVLVWGQRPLPGLPDDCTIVRLEDGFLRSVGLGAEFARPLSWVLDFGHLYFDATGASNLEDLLNSYPFSDEDRNRARNLLDAIRAAGVTKYNTGQEGWTRPAGQAPVILVPGQVESDASIEFGSPEVQTNLDLLKKVRETHPEAWVVYKPHPDVVAGARRAGQNESSAADWCDEIITDVAMGSLLAQVDEVHTMTSLAGFEALIRHKSVTCYGLPFYAGWGLTNDKLPCARRSRRLEITELAHAVLIQYPLYVSRAGGEYTTPETTLHELQYWQGAPLSWRDRLKKQARKIINTIRGKT